ncbi:MAG: hypothetical protein ACQXXC_10225 [Methanolinea tarda]|jgi:hypothetical protein|nr:hypothetical protein [Methanolinea sp.]
MADFVQRSVTKSAVRTLSAPLADAAAVNTIVNTLIAANPLGCTPYEVGGVTMAPVAKTRESYGARIAYEDDEAATVGTISIRAPTTAAFATVKSELLADAEITAAMGGDPVNLADRETYSVTVRCHDPSGEIYYLTFTRDAVRITSYESDSILTLVEQWADTVPALA